MTLAFSTCDFCDAHKDDHGGDFRVLSPVFLAYGQRSKFAGQVVTVKCHEDNTWVKKLLENEPGVGRVLVVDGHGSNRRALMGGSIAAAAAKNGWEGVVIFGVVRDFAELQSTDLGIRALGLSPMPTSRAGQGQQDVPVYIDGVVVRPGDWLYADADGMVLSSVPLHAISQA